MFESRARKKNNTGKNSKKQRDRAPLNCILFPCRITAKVPLGKGKEATTANDEEIHEENDNDKKTS